MLVTMYVCKITIIGAEDDWEMDMLRYDDMLFAYTGDGNFAFTKGASYHSLYPTYISKYLTQRYQVNNSVRIIHIILLYVLCFFS